MLGSHTPILNAVIQRINDSIAANTMPEVRITQVNLVMPDGRALTLVWDPEDADWTIITTGNLS